MDICREPDRKLSGPDLRCWATTLWPGGGRAVALRTRAGRPDQLVSTGNHPGDEEVWSGRKQGTEARCPTVDGAWNVELGVGERGHPTGLWGFGVRI